MGNIRGRITDTEKQALPGATVMIEDLHTGVTSDINGYYSLPNLKPGTYSVTVNGNRMPSAEGDTRNVQLDLIPSDMIQTIELNKVVTSDMDGDLF